ncbi:hypothetical protein [Nonomuraea sp. GTA35]|uniref:hypothetical protein n=1 Tax=Nonomuraea sp. GTA35 TaxID=1676746 RepID=UPI0035C01501
MSRFGVRLASLALAATAATGGLLVASPAQAASWTCDASWQTKSFDLPNKPDVTVRARACVYKDGNTRRARIQFSWDTNTGVSVGKRFDKFVVQARLERYDAVFRHMNCDYTEALNYYVSGSDTCTTGYMTSTAQNGWTSDGTIVYNIDGDGKDDFTWNLHGSDQVKVLPDGTEAADEPVQAPAPDPADTPEPGPELRYENAPATNG